MQQSLVQIFVMKSILFLLVSLFGSTLSMHANTMQDPARKQAADSASFVAVINIRNATKDGIYIDGYVVNIDYAKAKSLDGKKVKISGRVTIVKAAQTDPVEQGRTVNTKHIEHPYLQIISN
jgi:hypothetical protein